MMDSSGKDNYSGYVVFMEDINLYRISCVCLRVVTTTGRVTGLRIVKLFVQYEDHYDTLYQSKTQKTECVI